MHDSAGTSDSAASSGGSSSPPASSGDSRPGRLGAAGRFLCPQEASSAARLKLACKLGREGLSGRAGGARVAHGSARAEGVRRAAVDVHGRQFRAPRDARARRIASTDTPVLLSAGTPPPRTVDIIINLAPEVPACLAQTRRVAEIIDGDDARRRAGRARFKAYRDLGIQPASHNIRPSAQRAGIRRTGPLYRRALGY